ncbi:methyltransferase type 11 [Bacillus cereus]|nr:methyltransferase type 11 [Bacillus sp. AFS023182]PGY03764.1 methyltransferase type 11 [Bacillus cereus]
MVRFSSLFVLLNCVIVFLNFIIDRVKIDVFPFLNCYFYFWKIRQFN